jgi:secondary thiamine-phosphate synthase enzyme
MSPVAEAITRADRPSLCRPHRGAFVQHIELTVITARPFEFVDLTASVEHAVAAAGLWLGVVSVQTHHTTSGLLVNEHEPHLLDDLAVLFERLAPCTAAYAHDDFARRAGPLPLTERRNGHAHCRAALLRASEQLHVVGGVLHLGRWQRLFLVDFDGGQTRQVSLMLSGAISPE